MPGKLTDVTDRIEKSREHLSEKLDIMYQAETVIKRIQDYVYDTVIQEDSEGNYMKDENGYYIYNIADSERNKIVDEVVEYLLKKYF